ncbi:MAG: TIGR01777 family protein, partial [Planctomycetaceae bacterium]|nr:TIGR01777 family protein [Planctomycetaceae bacterium]
MGHIREYAATVSLPVPVEEAFAYHERPGALKRLVPPWESVEIERSDGSLDVGSRVVLTTRVFGYPVRWVAEHTEYDPPHLFADTQISGPFASWDHRHEFQSEGVGCSLKDQIAYRVPLGALGAMLGGGKALKTIERMFAFRHRLTRDDLQLHADRPTAAMRIAVSGSSGLVGGQLKSLLTLLGHEVRPLVRSISQDSNEIAVWNGEEQAEKLNDVDVVFHLAGKSIADGRWSDSVKQEIRDSR